MLDRVFDDDCDRGFRQNTGRGNDNFSLAGELLSDEVRLIFPSEVDVTDVSLHKGDGRSGGAGIENRCVLVQLFDELLDFDRIVVELFLGISPGGEVVPAGASRSFRVGRHDGHPVLHDIVPILDSLGVSGADHEDDRRGVGGAVVREPLLPILWYRFALGDDRVDVPGEG